jgi:hypothetical protein
MGRGNGVRWGCCPLLIPVSVLEIEAKVDRSVFGRSEVSGAGPHLDLFQFLSVLLSSGWFCIVTSGEPSPGGWAVLGSVSEAMAASSSSVQAKSSMGELMNVSAMLSRDSSTLSSSFHGSVPSGAVVDSIPGDTTFSWVGNRLAGLMFVVGLAVLAGVRGCIARRSCS